MVKNVSRNFSGAVVGCGVSSVSDRSLFQLVLVLKVYRLPPVLSQVNYRVLICGTCHFQSGSLCLF